MASMLLTCARPRESPDTIYYTSDTSATSATSDTSDTSATSATSDSYQ